MRVFFARFLLNKFVVYKERYTHEAIVALFSYSKRIFRPDVLYTVQSANQDK